MHEHERHVSIDWSTVFKNVCIGLACLVFIGFMLWVALSSQNSKLYEADNVVCVSQPLASPSCFERKVR